ncbi:helix-turn-helix domain-containing protein [Nostoc sp. CHAB 5784]|uniref:helix-turn-helix domain-containing protein n=1 Tax=Nostoc mirabile TaxID=2907820 RepID=UPI001E2923AF|nr:helix-turn-helix domain-containing protein [Nostoc mirabile]MCC5667212.1 helix-turn-helix domain-containing protein [Nostoc mirabile CHAB5784]
MALEDRNSLPDEPCVYLAIDKDNSVLYVGMSDNLRQKWKSHPKLEALSRLEGVKISYIRTEVELLRKLENALIKVFKPPLNLTEAPKKGIAALREKMGLTQKQLGDLVGVDTSTIRNWEYGKGSETFAKVARLCKVLECDIEDLFEEEAV